MAALALRLETFRRAWNSSLSWWIAEMTGMLPPAVHRLLVPRRDQLIVLFTSERVIVRRCSGGTQRVLLDEALTSGQGVLREALRSAIKNIELNRIMIGLQIPARLKLKRFLELPIAAEENLSQLLKFEMDRFTPFKAEAVYHTARVINRNREAGKIKIELLVLPKAEVEPLLQSAYQLGITPEALLVSKEGSESDPWCISFAESRIKNRWLQVRVPLILILVAFSVFGVSISQLFNRKTEHIDRLEQQIEIARKEAEQSSSLQSQIDNLNKIGSYLVDKKRERVPIVYVLRDLTRITPDDTWLYRLRLVGDELQTFGYSPNASAMIASLESAELFSKAQFRAPLTRDQHLNAEQFHIAVHVGKEGGS